MTHHPLILGVGSDPIPGIGFPFTNSLLAELCPYLADRPGQEVGGAFGTYCSGSGSAPWMGGARARASRVGIFVITCGLT